MKERPQNSRPQIFYSRQSGCFLRPLDFGAYAPGSPSYITPLWCIRILKNTSNCGLRGQSSWYGYATRLYIMWKLCRHTIQKKKTGRYAGNQHFTSGSTWAPSGSASPHNNTWKGAHFHGSFFFKRNWIGKSKPCLKVPWNFLQFYPMNAKPSLITFSIDFGWKVLTVKGLIKRLKLTGTWWTGNWLQGVKKCNPPNCFSVPLALSLLK